MSKDLTDALRDLTERPRFEPNSVPPPRGAARKVVSAATPPAARPSAGGGIASPLTETARTYHAERTVLTTDGLLSVRVTPVSSITFTDAGGSEVLMIFSDPAA